jgi:nucleoid DNA-binding protein
MNKGEFITYISEKNKITKAEAAKMLDMFTSSVIDALGAGKEISAYNQPKFKVGKTMKDAVNKK